MTWGGVQDEPLSGLRVTAPAGYWSRGPGWMLSSAGLPLMADARLPGFGVPAWMPGLACLLVLAGARLLSLSWEQEVQDHLPGACRVGVVGGGWRWLGCGSPPRVASPPSTPPPVSAPWS